MRQTVRFGLLLLAMMISVYFGSDDGFIYSVDSDGSLKWKSKLNGKIRSSSPCLYGDLIFIGTYNGGIYCLHQFYGTTNWYKTIEKPVLSSPLLVKDRIIFGASDCKLYCFDLRGSKLWEFETGGKIWSSLPAVKMINYCFLEVWFIYLWYKFLYRKPGVEISHDG
jgi:outer membrane protein assembly factor BamB